MPTLAEFIIFPMLATAVGYTPAIENANRLRQIKAGIGVFILISTA